MEAVGIRQLRHDASALVRRVEAGETIRVTVQGRPAAQLTPLRSGGNSDRSLIGSEFLSRLDGLTPDDTDWLNELRESRSGQPLSDPWERG
jgi:prevent-host-death family protein